MNKTLKYILNILLSAAVFFLLDRFVLIKTAFDRIHLEFGEPFAVFFSVIFGPVAGGLVGVLGRAGVEITNTTPDWAAVVSTGLAMISIGFFTRNLEIRKGFFERRGVVYFTIVQLCSNFVSWSLIYPTLANLIFKTRWYDAFLAGLNHFSSSFLSNLVISTLWLAVYAETRFPEANFYKN